MAQVWLPGAGVSEGEELQYDPTAYDCLSSMRLDWPCLSFDVLRDHLGGPRAAFPHTLFMVAGTQAAQAKLNYLAVCKVAGLAQGRHGAAAAAKRGKQEAGEESEEDDPMSESGAEAGGRAWARIAVQSARRGGRRRHVVWRASADATRLPCLAEGEEEEAAQLHIRKVAHTGGINRVRAMPQQQHVVATWADTAQVQARCACVLVLRAPGSAACRKARHACAPAGPPPSPVFPA